MNFTRGTTQLLLHWYQVHVETSRNTSPCHTMNHSLIVTVGLCGENDNFDANLLIIHWRNPRLPRPGKKRVLSTNAPCNQRSPIAAPRIIWTWSISSQEWNFPPHIGQSAALNDPAATMQHPFFSQRCGNDQCHIAALGQMISKRRPFWPKYMVWNGTQVSVINQ